VPGVLFAVPTFGKEVPIPTASRSWLITTDAGGVAGLSLGPRPQERRIMMSPINQGPCSVVRASGTQDHRQALPKSVRRTIQVSAPTRRRNGRGLTGLCAGRRNTKRRSTSSGLAPRRHGELRQNLGDVAVDGMHRQHELCRDLPICQSLSQEAEHLELPIGEARLKWCTCSACVASPNNWVSGWSRESSGR
jgi:hypothetical protein